MRKRGRERGSSIERSHSIVFNDKHPPKTGITKQKPQALLREGDESRQVEVGRLV